MLSLEVPGPNHGALCSRPAARVRFSSHGTGQADIGCPPAVNGVRRRGGEKGKGFRRAKTINYSSAVRFEPWCYYCTERTAFSPVWDILP